MKSKEAFKLGLYEKSMPSQLGWAEKLKAAKKTGYDFVEISVDETEDKLSRLDWDHATRVALNREMADAGIRLETMCLSGHRKYPLGSPDLAKCAQGLEIMRKAIDLSNDLGIRIIQLAGYDTYYDPSTPETEQRFAENLTKCADMAARDGVTLAFETMETPFMNTVGKAMRYVRMIDSPWLQVYPDVGNLTNAAVADGSDVFADLRAGAGHLSAVHLKETVPGKFREIAFGTGHVDFVRMIETAWALGVRRYTAEFWHLGEEDWMRELTFANEFLRARF